MTNAANTTPHFVISCRASRGNAVDILVDGDLISVTPAGGDLIRNVRGIVQYIADIHGGATFTYPGGIVDIFGIIRDASVLVSF